MLDDDEPTDEMTRWLEEVEFKEVDDPVALARGEELVGEVGREEPEWDGCSVE